MFDPKRFPSLAKFPAPLLTAYLKTTPDDASLHPPVPSCVAWLRQEANSLANGLVRDESENFRRQLRRVEEFLHDRNPREKSLVVFTGPQAWETVGLQVEVANELHWGKPSLTQLLWLAAEHKPYCIVLVDHSGATIYSYRLREACKLQETKFDVDTSQWKKKDRAHVARPGIRETHGAQRDVFDHRLEAQYRRLSRKVAELAIQLCRNEPFSAVVLAGPERLVAPIAGRFPAEIFARLIWIRKDLGRMDPIRIQEVVEPEIEKWESEQELARVNELLGDDRRAVLGVDETLAQLQQGGIRTLTVCRDLDARVMRCDGCGYMDFATDPVCGACRNFRSVVFLRSVLPELAAASRSEIEVVSGEAASKLKRAGGMGAWLRQSRQRRRQAALAPM